MPPSSSPYELLFWCPQCGKELEDVSKVTFFNDLLYHKDCVLCDNCKNSCGSKDFVEVLERSSEISGSKQRNGALCGKCFTNMELRCANCSLRFRIDDDREILLLENKHYHLDCFKCSNGCLKLLAKENFVQDNKRRPYCLSCYAHKNPRIRAVPRAKLDRQCKVCEKSFDFADTAMHHAGEIYHFNCFLCDGCSTTMEKRSIHPNPDGKVGILCDECWAGYNAKCGTCKKPLIEGENFIEYGGSEFHAECYKCTRCGGVPPNFSMLCFGQVLMCSECNESK